MDAFDSKNRVIELKRGGTIKLEGGRGIMVRAISGNVWLTQYKDTADHVMRAGNWMVLNGEGTTLISAFEDSSLRFVSPDGARLPCNIELRVNPTGVAAP